MTVTDQGLEVVTPVIDGALVDYWYLQSQAPLQEFKGLQREALGGRSIVEAMADYSMAAAGLHNRQLDSRFPGNPTVGTPEAQNLAVAKSQHTAGYLLAFVIVHQAGLTLDKLSDLYAHEYEDRISGDPELLEEDFHRDFADFPPILDLIDTTLAHPDSRFAATLMFAINGGAANPRSPLVKLAEIAEQDKTEGQVIVPTSAAELRQGKQARRSTKVNNRPTIR